MPQELLVDEKTGILYRGETFDSWIIRETRGYFPLGLTPSDVVLDIGGHIGSFAARALLECPGCQVSSVEAEQSNFEVLQKNAEKFGFDAVQAAVAPATLDGQSITVYVNEKRNNATHSTVPIRGRSAQQVNGVSLEFIARELRPTVIKCDIEGAEYDLGWDVLTEVQPRLVVMELHLTRRGYRQKAVEMIKLFDRLGFVRLRQPKIGLKNWTTLVSWRRLEEGEEPPPPFEYEVPVAAEPESREEAEAADAAVGHSTIESSAISAETQ